MSWSAGVESDRTNSNGRTDVRVTEPATSDKVELPDEPGCTELT